MIIRAARPGDRIAMARILNKIIAIGGTTAYEDPLEPDYFDQFLNAPDRKVFLHVAETGEGVQGFQWVEPLEPPESHIGGIATFAKTETSQRGIGTALFNITQQVSRQVGYSELVAKIRADNIGGLAYYTKMGFGDHSIIEGEPLQDGTPVDRVIKRLTL